MTERGGSMDEGRDRKGSTSSEHGEQKQGRNQDQNRSSGGEEKKGQGSGKEKQGQGGGQGKQGKAGKQGQGQGQQKEKPSRLEWIVGILCSVVVLTAVGYLFYQAFSGPDLPPLVKVRVERVVPMGGEGYLVEFKAINEGSGTAANLMVEGALMRDTVAVERSTATIQFVPAETEREGGLFFTKDPRLYRLQVRPTGFDRP